MNQYLPTVGAEIAFKTEGNGGPWVTLINGYTRSGSDFKNLAQCLKQRGFSVLYFDNRGSGETKLSHIGGRPVAFSLEDMCNDVLALWLKLGISHSHLLGISMGGIIAQSIFVKHSEKVDHLILVSTTNSMDDLKLEGREWGDTLDSILEQLNLYVSKTFAAKNALLLKAMAKQICHDVQEGAFLQRAIMQRNALKDFHFVSFANVKACPTLVLHGSEDQIIAADAARRLAANILGAKLKIYQGAGHLLLAERAKELYEDIVNQLT